MDFNYYNSYINHITIGRIDVTPIFENPVVFTNLIKDLIEPFGVNTFNKIAGIDALGFVIGGALAITCELGFVCIRKNNKLPGAEGTVLRSDSIRDYSGREKALEINKSAITPGDKVLLVDEWIETGSQVKTSIDLIERLGGHVSAIASLCAHRNENTRILFEKYNLNAIKIIED